MKKDVKILDCTIRDGGYLNDWRFDNKLVREVYRSASKAGVDVVEVGYRGTAKYFDSEKYGPWRFSEKELIEDMVSGIDGAKVALMADFGKIDVGDFDDARNSVVDMVRLAVHKHDLKDSVVFLKKIKKKGYDVSINVMGYSNYSPKEQKNLVSLMKDSGIDVVYIVDSYGSLFPNQIRPMIEPMLEKCRIKVGFHPHNSLQMAFANSLEAIQCGVSMIDSTFYGMGRGAGNLPTEILVLYMELLRKEKYNVIPILNCIDTYFLSLKKEIEWGHQLPFMLSGMYKCHPNYAKRLVDLREYTIEDISKAIEALSRQNITGYSECALNGILENGFIMRGKSFNRKTKSGTVRAEKAKVPYANRHKGRDFLILANGPTLKSHKNKIDKFINKMDPVIIGANNLSGLFIPHYHAFNNKKRFMMYSESVSEKSKLLLSQYFPLGMIREYTDRPYEKLYFRNVLKADFDIRNGVVQTNCRTISVLSIGIAIVMGAKRIFIAGMDGYMDYVNTGKFLYYDEKAEKTDRNMILEEHKWCQTFLDQINEYCLKNGHEGIHIVTPTTYKSFYKGIDNYIS